MENTSAPTVVIPANAGIHSRVRAKRARSQESPDAFALPIETMDPFLFWSRVIDMSRRREQEKPE
jgi:hypothetical protein